MVPPSAQQTLSALYSLPSYDFNDIVAGDNEGEGAKAGYDMVTGLGSPRANLLVPDLAAYGLAAQPLANIGLNVTTPPPTNVEPGQSFGLSVAVQDQYGNTDSSFTGSATLTSSLGGSPVIASVVNGVAVFDGLTLPSGQSASYTVSVSTYTTSTGVVHASVNEPSGSEMLYPAPSYSSLNAALSQAASDSNTNITIMLESGIYALNASSAAPLLIQNTSGVAKTITIEGAGMNSNGTIIEPSRSAGWGSSIFEIVGAGGAQLSVTIKDLTIEDGEATGGGVVGGGAALGGGLLIDGGDVALSQVALVHDLAVGAAGAAGTTGQRKRLGGPGGAGQAASGGGLYLAGGTLNLLGVTFQDDVAWGGRGGGGGVGGTDGGGGGSGGFGGAANGGAAFVAGGTISGSGNQMTSDAAVGGSGGYGGLGGLGGTSHGLGAGGHGGAAGKASGGGLFVGGGSVSLGSTPFTHDIAKGGNGGTGGVGGFGFSPTFNSSFSSAFSIPANGRGGTAGSAGNAEGGAIFVGGGSLTLGVGGAAATAIQSDRALGGFFGFGGDERLRLIAGAHNPSGGNGKGWQPGAPVPPIGGHHGGHGGNPSASGTSSSSSSSFAGSFQVGIASGGAIYVAGGSVTMYSQDVSNDLANYGGAIFNRAGTVNGSGLTMKSDSAESGGAVVNSFGGAMKIKSGHLSGNVATQGVDGYAFGSSTSFVGVKGSRAGAILNRGHLNLSDVTVANNSAKFGGGILNQSGAIVGSSLDVNGNKAVTRGGGIYSLKGSLTIDGGQISHNTVSATGSSPSVAIGSGGGIDMVSATATITGMTISANSARAGGGLYVSSGSATINGSDIDSNFARQSGGAIYGLGTISIDGGKVENNTARIDGGAIDNFDSLTIKDGTTLSGDFAGSDGGAIKNAGTVSLTTVTITGNSAFSLGGGIDNGGNMTILSSDLASNQADKGGGIFDVGALTLKNADTLSLNAASLSGGGIYEDSGGRVNATGLSLLTNTAENGNGGGIYDQRGALTIVGGEVSSNVAEKKLANSAGWGGGVYDTGGKVSLSNTPVEGNSAISGGGLYVGTGSMSLAGETIDDNTAVQFGGGILSQGTLTLATTTVTVNVAQQDDGGGIESLGKLTMSNSVLSQNSAVAGSGGDLNVGPKGIVTISQSTLASGVASTGGDAANAGILTISTSTLSSGSASGAGGGIANTTVGTVRLSNSTIADNSAGGNGGGIDTQGTVAAVNVTIALNIAAGQGGAGVDVESGSTTSLINTIVDLNTGPSSTDVSGTLSPSSSNNLIGAPNPGLDPHGLQNNGGTTQTIAIVSQTSPAIDGGSTALAIDPATGAALSTDQRGALRGTRGLNAGSSVDIGAYEASSSYLVTSDLDSETFAGTLRSGVDWASKSTNDNPENIAKPAPNTIVFDTSGTFAVPQTITLSSTLGTLVLPHGTVPIEIQGPGGGIVTISGGGQFQVVQVNSGATAILQGITITGGSAASGGGVTDAGNLTLSNTILTGNSATTGGGVYSIGNNGSLTIIGGTIQNNSAADGAGVYSGNNLTLTNVSIQGNTASAVGGGVDLPDGGTLTLTGGTITQNSAVTGGGLYLTSVSATMSGGSISGNSATSGGGVYSGGVGGALTITGTSFSTNSATTGGAIDSDAKLTVAAGTLLSQNTANTGGAIEVGNSGLASITASAVTGNSATGSGGGIDNNGNLTINSSTLSGNSANQGGAVSSQNGTLTIGGSTFSGNSATASGGGISDTNGQADVLTNTTLADNSAGNGGAIYASLAGPTPLTLVNTTVAYNQAALGGTGAGIDAANGTVALYNTIVDLNSGIGSTDVAGTTTGSNNLISVPSPGLAPGLANNGGTTQTIAIVSSISPAIDTGANTISGVTVPTTDQRGALRGNSNNSDAYAGQKVDIGAYESSSAYLVTSAADSNDLGTLRTAVSWANVSTNVNPAYLALTTPAPNTVDFDTGVAFSSPQTITLSPALGTLMLSNTVTPVAINGPSSGNVTISGGNAVGVIQVTSGVSADLNNLTISGGSAATGGGIDNAGTLALSGSTVESNVAVGSGGGINNTGLLTLAAGTTISGNSAAASGGGIDNSGTLTLFAGTTISGNSAAMAGGGIADPGSLTLSSLLVSGALSSIMPAGSVSPITISGNIAGTGGGIAVGGTLTDTGSTITGNSAATAGGGIAVQNGGVATLTGSTVSSNTAGSAGSTAPGGGIDNAGTLTIGALVTMSGSGWATITGNSATGAGGGIANESGGTLTVTYASVTNNSAQTSGGGLDNSGGATIAVVNVSNNSAATSGGGLGNELGGTLTLNASTLSYNSATSGGGLANTGTAKVTNATMAKNQAGTGGGVYDTGLLTVDNATIAYNTVVGGGTAGGLDAVTGTTTLYNTIVATNTASDGSASDAIGSLAPTSSFNLFGTGGAGGLSALDGNLTNVKNPGLGSFPGTGGLANNGGPTATVALLQGSPAIDAGSASIVGVTVPAIDQRGALRGSAGLNAGAKPDIGAYEASSSYQVSTTTDSNQIGTLRSAIAWANVSTNFNSANLAPNAVAPDTVVFNNSGAFSTPQTITLSLGSISLSNQGGESIDGTASNGLTISGGGTSQIFSVGQGAIVTLTGLTLTGGSSSTSGGAVTNSGTLTVSNSTLMGNSAADGGGAIDNLGTLNLLSSTLNANSAGSFGGAIDVETGGKFSATNSTIASNSAAQGGGIYSTGTLTAINDTVAYNTGAALGSGGGLNVAGGAARLYNSIVNLNTDTAIDLPADDIVGTVTGSDNVVGTSGTGLTTTNGNQIGVTNPGLAPGLAYNGGPTETIAISGTSPAIGRGAPTVDGQTITFDQRGALRGTTAIDVGSFELSSGYLVTSVQDSTVPGTLRSAIVWADSNLETGITTPLTIEFDVNHVFAMSQVITLGLGTMALTNTVRPIVIEGTGVTNLTISGNNASGVLSIAPGVNVTVENLTIADGMAAAGGGINNAGTLTVTGVSFANNSTPSGSGAAINNTGTLNVSNSSFSGNTGSYYGGAIYNDDGTATISDSNFVDNSTVYGLGGAIDNLGGSLTVTGGTFQGNTSFQGGAIYNRNDTSRPGSVLTATANLDGVTISGNSAYQGGGLFNEGVLSVSSSTVAHNMAFQGGAASNDFGGTMTISDSTLANNTAQQFGGAIDSVDTLTVVSSTIAYNVVTPGGSGAGIDVYAGTTALYDTIAVLNTIGTGTSSASNDITGQLAPSSSYNMIGTGGLANGVNNNLVGVLNPGLASGLASNGGPTQTIALFVGSPAIGAGSYAIPGVAVPTVDERGIARPANGYDIGAYQGSIPAPPTLTNASASTGVIVASPSSNAGPATATSNIAPLISGTTPFHGRHLNARGHRQAKTSHPKSGVHQAARAAAHRPKSVAVRIAKHR